jgi:2-dehydropantoate 2-reductase
MVVLGEPDDRDSARIRQLRRLLDKSGISSPAAGSIRQVIWNKLVQNLAGSALSLLTEQGVAGMRADPLVAAIASRLAAEGRAIAQACGIDIDGAPARPGGGHSAGAIAHKPSMLQDYERGRPLELEAQLLAPHAFASAAGVRTPTLDIIVSLAAAKAAAKGLHKKEQVPAAGSAPHF